jgi:hypothetical protein
MDSNHRYPEREAVLFAFAGWTFGACDKAWFALDSPLEEGVSCELVSENAKIPC